jgi:hypothetical protein
MLGVWGVEQELWPLVLHTKVKVGGRLEWEGSEIYLSIFTVYPYIIHREVA